MEVTSVYVRACLVRWGEWLRQGGGGACGYPSTTCEGRLRRDGTLVHGVGVRVVGDDPLAERLDRIIARLAFDDRRWPLMLRRYYGSEATTYEQVAAAVGREYGDRVSADCVRKWMREAEATIRGELRAHQFTGT